MVQFCWLSIFFFLFHGSQLTISCWFRVMLKMINNCWFIVFDTFSAAYVLLRAVYKIVYISVPSQPLMTSLLSHLMKRIKPRSTNTSEKQSHDHLRFVSVLNNIALILSNDDKNKLKYVACFHGCRQECEMMPSFLALVLC